MFSAGIGDAGLEDSGVLVADLNLDVIVEADQGMSAVEDADR